MMDFLFEYYAFRPAHLLRWTPGLGVVLAGPEARRFLRYKGFTDVTGGIALDPKLFPERRREAVQWIHRLLANTAAKMPFFGCSGMHEWAMVYRSEDVRHAQYPLRMEPEALAAFVESRPVVCSHYDAFRFFTEAARPLNQHQPTYAQMPTLEQPGCLHTNMDLYRWSFKLYPWIPASIVADAFDLACQIREVDMRASPYDLQVLGYAPITIETAEGRQTYQRFQREFAAAAAPIRTRLLEACERLLTALELPFAEATVTT